MDVCTLSTKREVGGVSLEKISILLVTFTLKAVTSLEAYHSKFVKLYTFDPIKVGFTLHIIKTHQTT